LLIVVALLLPTFCLTLIVAAVVAVIFAADV
jgi:hypothetical protein